VLGHTLVCGRIFIALFDSSCWIAIHNVVYDFTEFLSTHPGGKGVLLKVAGKDGTSAFDAIHSRALLDTLPKEKHLGVLDGSASGQRKKSRDEARVEMERRLKPPIQRMLSLKDIEVERFRPACDKVLAYLP
jgi:L-lactate dehydrogenase (cytochrome)